jgi:hypothetical protein
MTHGTRLSLTYSAKTLGIEVVMERRRQSPGAPPGVTPLGAAGEQLGSHAARSRGGAARGVVLPRSPMAQVG